MRHSPQTITFIALPAARPRLRPTISSADSPSTFNPTRTRSAHAQRDRPITSIGTLTPCIRSLSSDGPPSRLPPVQTHYDQPVRQPHQRRRCPEVVPKNWTGS